MEPLTLPALVEQHIGTRPGAAIVDGERILTSADLDLLGRRTAGWLRSVGIVRGDRIAVWLPNGTPWLALLLGTARVGATVIAVNTRFRAAELEHILERSEARLLVLQPDFHGIDFGAVLRDVRPEALRHLERIAAVGAARGAATPVCGKPTLAFDVDALDSGSAPAAPEPDPDAYAVVFTTSGTTRAPKLVVHSQRTIALHASRIARAHGITEGARLLAALPLCGVFGLDSTLAAIAAGARVVLMDTFDGRAAAALIVRHGITHMYGSDEMFRRLIDAVEGHDPFPSLKMLGTSAFNPGAVAFARAGWERRLPFIGMYGSSEVQALFAAQPLSLPLEQRIEPGGRPASPEAEVRVRDVDTGALLPPGGTGELEIRAATNFVGYLGDPGATANAFRDGFFRTGDVGHLRGDGTFVYQSRGGDALRIAGYLVSPSEIEDALKRIPAVADAQVVGIPIEGELRVCAFVIPAVNPAPNEADVIVAARRLMAGFKVPARVWFVDGFPATQSANGVKVQRAELRRIALERVTPSQPA